MRIQNTFPLLWGGGLGRGRGVSSGACRLEGPLELASSCRVGFGICLGALIVGRAFLFPPLRSEILARSSDIAIPERECHAVGSSRN
jgi:hypothetical protein